VIDQAPTVQRRTFLSQLFAFRGRSTRTNFWLSLLVIVVAYVAALIATSATFSQSDEPQDIHPTGVAIVLLSFVTFFTLYTFAVTRRFHDRGKSARWLWLFPGIPFALGTVSRMLEHQFDLPQLAPLPVTLALPFVVWGFVECGFLRGTPGPNQFGADRGAATEEAG
jgi:uncharacterized membrane protein YhaH (DUF805 family)